ncbi:hypothetical protein P152DRAFT_204751 [Eremomyces bilateralis CBS 781.70]|uniref:Myb-like domain-containing protein n=1 Tax=Eremomyces bilateralis CBS 781.70 TaxID=1392243 RepID=A0A6G1FT13_9PEZI|nr:uncharacterized protein P152DRAFT_204751 [Eremomyces bilateralis CBS 781.70]KAF1808819.1 hypothetical protein P152DRAFT_204751 [Eremomyces bilateralis CBS 781.70]
MPLGIVRQYPDPGLDCSGRRENPRMFHRVGRERPGSVDAEASPQEGDEREAANTSTIPRPTSSPHAIRAYKRCATDDPIHEHSRLGDTADYSRGCDTDEEHAVDDDHGTRSPRPSLGRQHRGKIQRRHRPFQSDAARNTRTHARDQPIPRFLSSPHPDSSAPRRDDSGPQDSDKSAPFAMARSTVVDISLRPTPGDTFLAATMKVDGDMQAISCGTLLKLIENILGNTAKIHDMTLKPLTAGQWLLTGFLRSRYINAGVTTRHEFTPNPRRDTTAATTIPMANPVDSEDDSSVGRSDSSISDDDVSNEKYIDQGMDGETRRRWAPLEEQRLLAYRADGKPWPWIFRKFPNRTPGAVRVRLHMLQRSQEGKSE